MDVFDKDKIRLAALNYAEKNKIVNEKSIQAFIAGFELRNSKDSDSVLSVLENKFKGNYDLVDSDIGYSDMRGESASNRKKEGHDALEIYKDLKELHQKINEFNAKYRKQH